VRFFLFSLLLFSLSAIGAETAINPPQPAGLVSSTASETNLSTEDEYAKLQANDDAAQAEVDKWLRQREELMGPGAGPPDAELTRRIHDRLEPIRHGYEEFLRQHPGHARAHLAYGNFLNERQDEAGAQAQWEKVIELDPKNAAAYNNLAGRYSEIGPAKKVFEFFSKAIELSPSEPVYYHNFADSMCVLSKHAVKYYGVSEQEVYGKALQLYSNAARLAPESFTFASDWAQTYYSIKPLPADDALRTWTNALKTAHDEREREETYVHMARVKMLAGRLAEARAQLSAVTDIQLVQLRSNLLHAIQLREDPQPGTNGAPGAALKNP
jgi:tetratricopeptide (TPR) repeat protein